MREKVPYPISDAQRQNYASAGYIKLDQVLPEKELRQFAAHLNPLMEALNPNKEPLEKRSTYRKAFNQVTNLWQKDEQVKQFATSNQPMLITGILETDRGREEPTLKAEILARLSR